MTESLIRLLTTLHYLSLRLGLVVVVCRFRTLLTLAQLRFETQYGQYGEMVGAEPGQDSQFDEAEVI